MGDNISHYKKDDVRYNRNATPSEFCHINYSNTHFFKSYVTCLLIIVFFACKVFIKF